MHSPVAACFPPQIWHDLAHAVHIEAVIRDASRANGWPQAGHRMVRFSVSKGAVVRPRNLPPLSATAPRLSMLLESGLLFCPCRDDLALAPVLWTLKRIGPQIASYAVA